MVSVITPAYNRAYILSNCYESLKRQTSSDFEWIVVDDGSTDNTEQTVKKFIEEGKIPITYIYQKNGGKHRAHNTAVKAAKGELCVCVDSDDMLTDNAIEVAIDYWKKHSSKRNIGILAKRGKIESREPICSAWPKELTECTMFSLINDYKFQGDTILFFRTELLKQNLFQEFQGEKFLSEANMYYELDRFGTMLLLDQVLYLCEYLPDGLTAKYHKLLRTNPAGTANTYYKQIRLASGVKDRLKYAVLTNIYLNLCQDKKKARVRLTDFWLVITWAPTKFYYRKFLRRFE